MPNPFIPAQYTAKVIFMMTMGGQQIRNILHYKNSTAAAFSAAQRLTLGQENSIWWGNYIAPLFSSGLSLYAVMVVNQDTQDAPSTLYTLPSPSPGADPGAGHPLNSAICVSLRTDLRGRSYRGRWYQAGNTQSNTVNVGTFTTSLASALVTAFARLYNPLQITNGILSIVSKQLNLSPRVTAAVTPVTAIVVETLYDSMRKRLYARGI